MPKHSLQQKLSFNFNLTPLLKNSINLLSMPYDDLLVEVNNALKENIILTKNTKKTDEFYVNNKINEDSFAKLTFKESLFSSLENQLPNIGLTEKQLNIAYIMLENLTEVGFLEINIEAIIRIYSRKHSKDQVNIQQCEMVKNKMQTNLDPFGIASFNTQDFLLLQVNHKGNLADQSLIVKLLSGETDISQITEIQRCNFIKVVKYLNKTPADNLGNIQNSYIQPDIFINKADDGWRISLKKLPAIMLNKEYLALRKQIPDKTLFNEHLSIARGLVDFLTYRNQYLQRISKALVAKQHQALNKGLEYILPLTQKQLALELDMGESTLSRLIKNKYMDTPIGTIKIQDLFSANVGNHAAKSIQHRIIQIIHNESIALSDQKICDLLTRDRIVICRRTITKYRKKLNIPCARYRKLFNLKLKNNDAKK